MLDKGRSEGVQLGSGGGGVLLKEDGFDYKKYVAVTTFSGTLPDPASWILMIGGFGITGLMMRRQRHQLSAI